MAAWSLSYLRKVQGASTDRVATEVLAYVGLNAAFVKIPIVRIEATLTLSSSQSIAANALLGQFSGGSGKPHGGSGHSSGGLGNLAGQLIGGLGNSHGGGSSGSHSGGGGSSGLVGQLASNLFSSGQKPEQSQNYHGGQSHSSGGLAGQVMGGVSGMFGGHHGKPPVRRATKLSSKPLT